MLCHALPCQNIAALYFETRLAKPWLKHLAIPVRAELADAGRKQYVNVQRDFYEFSASFLLNHTFANAAASKSATRGSRHAEDACA